MTTTTAPAYSIQRVDGSGLSLSDCKAGPTMKYVVQHADGTVAYSSSCYMVRSMTAKQIAGLRLQCARQLPRFEAYLAKTGKRWEVEQKELRDAERATKKRAERIAHLSKIIPELQAELAKLQSE